jgi:hypothetical protein
MPSDLLNNKTESKSESKKADASIGHDTNPSATPSLATPLPSAPLPAAPSAPNKSSRKTPFWFENPNVLFDSEYVMEFFPVSTMNYNQKLNAISRTVIVATILLFLFTRNPTVLIAGIVTLGSIYLVFNSHDKEKRVRFRLDDAGKPITENFENPSDGLARYTLEKENVPINPDLFDNNTPNNPFSNVLLTDYETNPKKKPAPASYSRASNNNTLQQAKEFVKMANPDQPDIADKLFKDLGEELDFEQSMRQFYSNPSTTIPNDQQAFADFCYGSMVSCKEGNMFACARGYQAVPVA